MNDVFRLFSVKDNKIEFFNYLGILSKIDESGKLTILVGDELIGKVSTQTLRIMLLREIYISSKLTYPTFVVSEQFTLDDKKKQELILEAEYDLILEVGLDAFKKALGELIGVVTSRYFAKYLREILNKDFHYITLLLTLYVGRFAIGRMVKEKFKLLELYMYNRRYLEY